VSNRAEPGDRRTALRDGHGRRQAARTLSVRLARYRRDGRQCYGPERPELPSGDRRCEGRMAMTMNDDERREAGITEFDVPTDDEAFDPVRASADALRARGLPARP